MGPHCHQTAHIHSKGTYSRINCSRKINQPIFRLLSKGCSKRGCAQILGVTPETVARSVVRFGKVSEIKLEWERKIRSKCQEILIDEMESFEHTKLKPLTIHIAVEKSRHIRASQV